MKYLVLITLFIACTAKAEANKIDKLKTDEDVEKFMKTEGKLTGHFHLRALEDMYEDSESLQLAKKLGVKTWQKKDLNNDGRTDLLVYNGETFNFHTIVVIDDGGQFKLQYFGKMFSVHYPVVGMWNGYPCLRIFTEGNRFDANNKKVHIITDTTVLVYQFGCFMEAKARQTVHNIERIEYKTSGCYGTCPIFSLNIFKDRYAKYYAERFNKTEGIFTAKIDTASFNTLIVTLNYTDFPALENSYAVGWTDDQTATLTITYDHGKIKKISDYGLQGSYGLQAVYQMLFNLRNNQNWILAKD